VAFLNKGNAIQEFFLCLLVKHHKNVIINHTRKDSLSYTYVQQRLMDIETSKSDDHTTRFPSNTPGNTQKGKKSSGKSSSDCSSPKSNACTCCTKHNPGRSEGHTWNEFFHLPKLNKEKKQKEKEEHEEANITTEIKDVSSTQQRVQNM